MGFRQAKWSITIHGHRLILDDMRAKRHWLVGEVKVFLLSSAFLSMDPDWIGLEQRISP